MEIAFRYSGAPVAIQFREILCDQSVSYLHPHRMLIFFQTPAQRQQVAQLDKPAVGRLKKLALSLGDQIRHIGAVLGVVLIPATVQRLPIIRNRLARYQYQHLILRSQLESGL